MAKSKLPVRVREALRKHDWIEYAFTSRVEAYRRGTAIVYIQRSDLNRDRFVYVIDYQNGKSENNGVDTEELVQKLREPNTY